MGGAPAIRISDVFAGPWRVMLHEGRQHMASDIVRNIFAATFDQEFGYSARLKQYPVGAD